MLAKDLLKLQRAPDLNIRALLRPATFVPESKGLNDLLREFRGNRNHLAIVIDEFGRVAGLITIEDVLEQIVGEIEDEFDIAEDEGDIFGLADHTYRVSGDTPIERVAEAFGITLDEEALNEDFDTIGGLIAHEMGHVPKRGEHYALGAFDFVVLHNQRRCGPVVQGLARARRRRGRLSALARALGIGLAGLAQAVAIAAPWNGQPLWWLQLLSLTALVWQLDGLGPAEGRRPSWRSAVLYGWLFATAWLCGTFWWLFISLHTYGGLAAPLAAVAVFLLAGAPCALLHRCLRVLRGIRACRSCHVSHFFSLRCGRWPNCCAIAGLPAFRGAQEATRTLTDRWPLMRRGSASTDSERWPRALRQLRVSPCAIKKALRGQCRPPWRWPFCACLLSSRRRVARRTTPRNPVVASASRCSKAISPKMKNSFPAAASRLPSVGTGNNCKTRPRRS